MEPFITLTGVVAPFLEDDLNTDQILPVIRTKGLKPDYAALTFFRRRYLDDGSENPDFILNQPRFRATKMLVGGNNFGCGSSREGAVWSLTAFGIRCIVARSFADIFIDNCLKNGVLTVVLADEHAASFEKLVVETDGAAPFTADLTNQCIRCPDGAEIPFDIGPAERTALLEGLDDIGLTLKHADAVAQFEQRIKSESPWLQSAADSR